MLYLFVFFLELSRIRFQKFFLIPMIHIIQQLNIKTYTLLTIIINITLS